MSKNWKPFYSVYMYVIGYKMLLFKPSKDMGKRSKAENKGIKVKETSKDYIATY